MHVVVHKNLKECVDQRLFLMYYFHVSSEEMLLVCIYTIRALRP